MKNLFSLAITIFVGLVSHPSSIKAESLKPSNKPLCEKLARMANSGELWQHILPGRSPTKAEEKKYQVTETYSGTAEPRTIYEIGDQAGIHKYASFINPNWGSCSGFRIWNLGSNTDTRTTPQIEFSLDQGNSEGEVDLSEAGANDEMISIDKESFVISTYYYFDQKTLKAASIAKNGRVDPICEFSSGRKPNLATRKAVNLKICNDVSEGRVKPLSWNAEPTDIPLQFSDGIFPPSEHVEVDLNKDGKKEVVGLSVEDSGARCGSTTIYLATENKELNDILATNEDKFGRRGWGHNRYDSEYDVHLFIIENNPFVLGNSELVSLWGNKKKIWCEFESLVQHHVKTVYQSVSR